MIKLSSIIKEIAFPYQDKKHPYYYIRHILDEDAVELAKKMMEKMAENAKQFGQHYGDITTIPPVIQNMESYRIRLDAYGYIENGKGKIIQLEIKILKLEHPTADWHGKTQLISTENVRGGNSKADLIMMLRAIVKTIDTVKSLLKKDYEPRKKK